MARTCLRFRRSRGAAILSAMLAVPACSSRTDGRDGRDGSAADAASGAAAGDDAATGETADAGPEGAAESAQRDAAAAPTGDAASLCEPLSCGGDGGRCGAFEWPSTISCDPVAMSHGYGPPTISIGCGYIVTDFPASAGRFFQKIYDETTGELLGTRDDWLGQFECQDSRPDVRRSTTKLEPWPTCASARHCFTCALSPPDPGAGYTCTAADGSLYHWSPPDGGL